MYSITNIVELSVRERLDDCGAPKYFNPPSLSHRPAVSSVSPRPKHRHTGLHSQHCTGSVQEGEDSRGESGREFHSRQTETLLTVCVAAGHHDPVISLYELSRASRTFMICCLMTLVASPALGIKYLSGGGWERKS